MGIGIHTHPHRDSGHGTYVHETHASAQREGDTYRRVRMDEGMNVYVHQFEEKERAPDKRGMVQLATTPVSPSSTWQEILYTWRTERELHQSGLVPDEKRTGGHAFSLVWVTP